MGSDRDQPEEKTASAVVAATLGLKVRPHDVCGLQSAYDFTADPDGKPQALEVVRCANPTVLKNGKAAARYAGSALHLAGLRRVWSIFVEDDRAPVYAKLARQLQPPLLAAEAAGLSDVFAHERWSLDRPGSRPVAAALARLRIWHAMAIDAQSADDEGLVQLVTMSSGSAALGSEPALAELEDYLRSDELADVRQKLANSQLPRRHAFVWVQRSGAFTSWRFFGRNEEFTLPKRPPCLPSEVTDVWWTTEHRGWRWSSDGWFELHPWRLAKPPEVMRATAAAARPLRDRSQVGGLSITLRS